MKRLTALAAVLLAISSIGAFATVSINWVDYQLVLGVDAVAVPVGSIWQLIWSPDNAISALDPFDPLTPQGGEVLLAGYTNIVAGRALLGTANYDELDYGYGPTETNAFAGGYAYMRVFNSLAVDGTPTGGTWYGEGIILNSGPLLTQHTTGTPPDPMIVDITGGPGGSDFTLDQQLVVPEPATWALLGFGVLVMAARRRFLK